MKLNRKKFLATASAMAWGIAPLMAQEKSQHTITHHVFFWLKKSDSKEDLSKLVDGLTALKKIQFIQTLLIGVPAATEKRDVVDDSYSASLLLFFKDIASEQEYQIHPIHLQFIEQYSPLWKKVVVYDTLIY